MFYLKSYTDKGTTMIEFQSEVLLSVVKRFQKLKWLQQFAFAVTEEEMVLMFRIPEPLSEDITPEFFKSNASTVQ